MSQNAKLRLLNVLIGLNLALIWGNSMLPGEDSGAISGGIVAWLGEFIPFFATDAGHTLLRKAAHFSEFALLGMLWCGRYRLRHGRVGFGQTGLGLAVACIDETIQIISPGRASSLLDVWLDTAGFGAGLCAISLGYMLLTSKKTNTHHTI